jgi:hypothetical protein
MMKKIKRQLGPVFLLVLMMALVWSGCTPTQTPPMDHYKLLNSTTQVDYSDLNNDLYKSSQQMKTFVNTNSNGQSQIDFANKKGSCALNPLGGEVTELTARPLTGCLLQLSKGRINIVWKSEDKVRVNQDINLDSLDPAVRIIAVTEQYVRIAVYFGNLNVRIKDQGEPVNLVANEELWVYYPRFDRATKKAEFNQNERDIFQRLGRVIGIEIPAAPATTTTAATTTSAAPVMTFTSPTGGETWSAGSTQKITWVTPVTTAGYYVGLTYSMDGAKWMDIINKAPLLEKGLVWTIPATPIFANTYQVKAIVYNTQGESIYSTLSKAFSIVRSAVVPTSSAPTSRSVVR